MYCAGRKYRRTCKNVYGKKVVALVPTHNKEDVVSSTINSLVNQTYPLERIVIILDNCTDGTEEVVAEEVRKVRQGNKNRNRKVNIEVIKTVDNQYKKSGALNFVYEKLDLDCDYVLAVDADTVVDKYLTEQAMEEFRLDSKLGAVCSRAGVIKQPVRGFVEKIIYHLQYVEYGEFDRSRVGQDRKIRVVHGMCAVYSMQAIKSVMAKREESGCSDRTVYNPLNITEDYELTILLKELGYHVAAGFGMYAWTYVPLRLDELWKQRCRWLLGGLDTLWEHGWNNATRKDIMSLGLFWFILLFQLVLCVYAAYDLYFNNYHVSREVVAVIGLMWIDSVYTLRFVQKKNIWDYVVRILYVPQMIYAWFTIAQQLNAYRLFFKSNRKW